MQASWLVAVLAVLTVCCPSAGALCWESSVCSDLRSNRRLLVGPAHPPVHCTAGHPRCIFSTINTNTISIITFRTV